MLKSVVIIASLAAATTTFAAPNHLTDGQYLEAARCQVLMGSSALGSDNAKAIDTTLKSEGRGRVPAVFDRVEEVQHETTMAIRHADSDSKAKLIAERNGVCESLAGVTAPTGGQSAGAN